MLRMSQTTEDTTGHAEVKLYNKVLARDGESAVIFEHMVGPDTGQDDSSRSSRGKFQGIILEYYNNWEVERIEEPKKRQERI